MSKFLIRWDKKAVEFLRKMDRKTARRIIKKMDEVAINPAHYLEPLKEVNAYKIRVGGHRKNIYKNL